MRIDPLASRLRSDFGDNSEERLGSPLKFLLILATALFIAEGFIMVAFRIFSVQPSVFWAIIDATLLTAVCFPMLYFFSYRPMEKHFAARRKLQAQMALSEKMAAVGLLASAIAHEINNPLNNILGLSQILLADDGLPEELRSDLRTIEHEAQRGGRLTTEVLNFTRPKRPNKEAVSLVELLEGVLPLVEHDLFRSDVFLEKRIVGEAPTVFADSDQIEQALINLILNAKQAVEESPEKKIVVSLERQRGVARIVVEDTGCGIRSEDLGRVFDPFFTTKPPGVGTGLGLSICYGIATENGGTVTVRSKFGQGSTFTLELPEHPREPE